MKKTSVLVLSTVLCLMCSCGNDNASSVEQSSQVVDTRESNTVSTDTVYELPSTDDTDKFFDLRGIQMKIPTGFEEANVFSKSVWNNESKTIYYDIDYLPDYGSVASSDSYNLDDTPEIMWEYILEVVDGFYPAGESKSTYSVDSEEKRTMIGYDVIRRTGTIHAEKYGETHELKYAAYYGLFDLQNGAYQKIPTVWIAFSETEGTSDLEDVVDTAFDNAKLSN